MKFIKKDLEIEIVDNVIPNGYKEITEEQYNEIEQKLNYISQFKCALKNTDYKCLKYIDGELTEEEYSKVKEQRKKLRNYINEIEAEIIGE